MKKKVLVIALMVVPFLGFAEWMEPVELVNNIPEGYDKKSFMGDAYDEMFYRMMQLGRGVFKGDRLVFEGVTETQPNQIEDGKWLISMKTLIGPYDIDYSDGEVLLILSEMPEELLKNEGARRVYCWVFARYEGVKTPEYSSEETLPVLICERIAIVKSIIDVQTFEYDEDINLEDLKIKDFPSGKHS